MSRVRGQREYGRVEHRVRHSYSDDGAYQLDRHIGRGCAARDIAAKSHGEHDQRIEVRSRQWRKPFDQGEQRGPSGQGVGQQRHRGIAGREPLSQNARADHRDQQEAGAERLRHQTDVESTSPGSNDLSDLVGDAAFDQVAYPYAEIARNQAALSMS